VGIVEEMVDGSVGEETRHAVERAIEVLIELGATVQRVSLPLLYEGQAVHTAVVDTEAASYHRERLLTSYLQYEYNTRVRLMVGALLPSGMQTLATRVRASIGKQVLDALEHVDILVGATSAGPAEQIPTETGIFSKEDAMEKLFKRSGRVGTTAFNMAGTPAASIPCGFSGEGLPLGFHIAGRRFEEGMVLKVADAYQRVTDWHRKRPTFA
jgi:aspartyl-tRNA(Asn)/glutamyl-tRNA(Gln) amidotransferase subunit A